ncbi:hypothetical protein FCK90_14485 [Kocuria coralli]|uniref:Uncharacterized protein n=1 Tax=Kocuria coralli TaxID=1461025 RepID=A0A5J5KUF2_9MICC|nr:hypothetical protein FCK90_14485 [Kocuria coralli]
MDLLGATITEKGSVNLGGATITEGGFIRLTGKHRMDEGTMASRVFRVEESLFKGSTKLEPGSIILPDEEPYPGDAVDEDPSGREPE